MSGLGGAFHHPSCTKLGPRPPAKTYPEPALSFRTVARRLLTPTVVISGGTLWLASSLLAVLVFLAVGSAPNISRLASRALAGIGIDAFHTGPPAAWTKPLLASGGLAAACLGSFALLWLATQWTKIIFRWSRSTSRLSQFARWFDHPRWSRRYLPALMATVAAVALPWFATVLLPLGTAHVVAIEMSFLLLVGVAVVGLVVVVAVVVGAEGHDGYGKLGFAFLGLVHAGLQLATPTLVALMGFTNPWIVIVEAIAIVVFTLAARRVSETPHPWRNLVLWLLCGAGCVAIPLLLAGSRPLPLSGLEIAFGMPLLVSLGAFLGPIWLGWYLFVALGFSGHNNEAGAAARVDAFRQFIRFRVEPDRIVGHVIGVGRPKVVGGRVEVPTWLVDRFAVGPTRPRALTDHATPEAASAARSSQS